MTPPDFGPCELCGVEIGRPDSPHAIYAYGCRRHWEVAVSTASSRAAIESMRAVHAHRICFACVEPWRDSQLPGGPCQCPAEMTEADRALVVLGRTP